MTPKHSRKEIIQLKRNIRKCIKEAFEDNIDNPVLKARTTWNTLSEQIKLILGDNVHKQWFRDIRPIVLKENALILQTPNQFAAQWINTHYQELAENLLHSQDRNCSCFFIGPSLIKR